MAVVCYVTVSTIFYDHYFTTVEKSVLHCLHYYYGYHFRDLLVPLNQFAFLNVNVACAKS